MKRKRINITSKFNWRKILASMLIACNIIAGQTSYVVASGNKIMTVEVGEGSKGQSSLSKLVNIPNLKSIVKVTTNTGTVTHTVSGEDVTLNLNGGTPSRVVNNPTKYSKSVTNSLTKSTDSFPSTNSYSDAQGYKSSGLSKSGVSRVISGIYTPSESKTETTTRSSQGSDTTPANVTYDSGGFYGTLSKIKTDTDTVQTGGSPADSKFVDNQTSSNYNSGGYSGTLSKYVYSGEASKSKTVTDTRTSQGSNTNPSSISYNSGGYSGTLSRGTTTTESILTGGTPADSKEVTGQTGANYNSEGYSGTLSEYVYSGSYTPADSKEVTGQTSSSYNSGGYSGTLSSYVYSGSYTPADSKYVTDQLSEYYNVDGYKGTLEKFVYKTETISESSKYVEKVIGTYYSDLNEFKNRYEDTKYYYNEDGYEGHIRYGGWYPGPTYSVVYRGEVTRPQSTNNVYRYQGTVTKPASDTRVYRYKGTVTKPAVDTRVYRYKGTVSKPDTRTYRTDYTSNYSGTVYTPDTREYRYKGTVTKPDTRTYRTDYTASYSGTVTKPASDTRTWQQDYSGTAYKEGTDNYYSYTVTIEYIGNTAPAIVVTNPTTNQTINSDGTITISGTVTDPDTQTLTVSGTIGGKTKTTTIMGPAANKPWELAWSGTELDEGTYSTTTITVTDGEVSETAGHTGTKIVDKTPPVKPTLVSSNTDFTNQNVQVTVNYSADSVTKQYRLGTGTWTNYASPITITDNINVYARGIDSAGNISAESSLVVDNINKVLPMITIGDYIKTPTNQSITVNASVDKGVLNKTSHTFDNNGDFTFIATDKYGNTAQVKVVITNIDKTKPSIKIKIR